jgi:hypothetical protein
MTSIKSTASSSSQSADESLWLKLLRESSTRGVTPDASCIIVGDADGAKGIMDSVGQSFASNHDSSSQDTSSFLEMLCYDCMDIIEDGALETNTKIHFWNFDERLISLNNELLPPPLVASNLHKVSCGSLFYALVIQKPFS